jgi:hypothetical protein
MTSSALVERDPRDGPVLSDRRGDEYEDNSGRRLGLAFDNRGQTRPNPLALTHCPRCYNYGHTVEQCPHQQPCRRCGMLTHLTPGCPYIGKVNKK